MSEKPPIIDAEFEDVTGPWTDQDKKRRAEQLAAELRAKGIDEHKLREIFREAGHPDFQPGGRHYRKPKMPLLQKLGIAGMVVIIALAAWDIATRPDSPDPRGSSHPVSAFGVAKAWQDSLIAQEEERAQRPPEPRE